MVRLLLVLCVAPVFALLLAGMVGASMARRPPGGRAAVTALAPALYAAVVVVAATVAAASVGFRPAQLARPVPGLDGPLWTVVGRSVAMVAAGVLLGVLAYFGELVLAERRLRRATGGGKSTTGTPATGAQPVGMRAVRSWAGNRRALVGLGLVTAVAEELLFRGYLLTGLRADLPGWTALLVQAGVFALHHGSFGWRAVPAKFVHGLVWGAAVVVAGSVLPALAAHAAFQLLACRRLVRERRTPRTGGDFHDAAQRAAAV